MRVDSDFLSILGNLVQLVGTFILVLQAISSAKERDCVLDDASQRMAHLRRDLADVELQVERARSRRPTR